MACLFVSCGDFYPPSEPFNESEIPGRYVASHGDGREYIELREDSSYVHFWVSEDGIEHTEGDRWSFYVRDSGYYSLSLWDFTRSYKHLLGSLEPEGWNPDAVGLTYKKWRGKLRIIVHPTENIQYIKQP